MVHEMVDLLDLRLVVLTVSHLAGKTVLMKDTPMVGLLVLRLVVWRVLMSAE